MADREPIAVPEEWIRNRADEKAVAAGCRWAPWLGEHFIDTVQENFRLYEGSNFAGELVKLMPYQIDFSMRLFSWVQWSDFYGRWIRRFRRASLWVPKKNGKSPFAAMVGNYLTVADGEVGGKTYAVAKDGQQARIVHDHAVKMVEQSPELLECCKVTLNPERRITHLPTMSWFGVLAADNVESQEGRNGNAIIDEAHVVVNRLARVLKYMGASREEPIELAVSTAGDNVDGWGYKRQEHGQRVNAGEIVDQEFLHEEFAAPAEATDEELLDPVLWRRVNPAMGHIIDEERFGQEVHAALAGGLQEWSDYKKYRFNIWQHSASPWLNLGAWQRAADIDDQLEDGEETWGGLDLSATSDFTAFAMVQRRGDQYIARVRHFVSERRARKHANNGLPVFEWARDGWVTICDGNRIDYEQVFDVIESARLKYGLQSIGFDKQYAENFRQRFEAAGVDVVEVAQNYQDLSNPSKLLANLVESEDLHSGGDPVLAWQAKNVTRKSDDSDRIRPVKPDRNSLKAVDGIVALIMAIREASSDAVVATSVYDSEWDF